MKTKTKPWPTVNTYRPSLRSYSFAAHTAEAIAQREAREDEHFAGTGHGPASGGTAGQGRAREHALGFPPAGCCAYTEAGNICGVTPAPFLDFVRGGFVCPAHKPERRPA